MKNINNTLMGFDNINDYMTSIFNLKHKTLFLSITFLTTLTTFISNYVYNDYKAVYFLLFLIAFDTLTGIYRALKTKSFTSKRLPRMLLIMITYVCLLACGWEAGLYSKLLTWVSPVLYGGFISTLFVSVLENVSSVGLLPSGIAKLLEDKLNFKNLIENKNEK